MNGLIDKFLEADAHIKKMDSEKKRELVEIDEKINNIDAEFQAVIDGIIESRGIKIAALEKEKNQIKDKAADSLVDYNKTVQEAWDIVNVLNTCVGEKIHKLTEKDFKKALQMNCSLHFYDEMYDSEAISLRAVIVAKGGIISKWKGEMKYHLLVIGHCKNEYVKSVSTNDLFCVGSFFEDGIYDSHSIKPYNVHYAIETSGNLKELKEYYFNSCKKMEGKRCAYKYLKTVIENAEMGHANYEQIKIDYSMEDFKPILKQICPKCGKGGSMRDSSQCFLPRTCNFCGSHLANNGGDDGC